ncbi:MAG: serine hydrolase domain-containing protein [Archangium sp.]|nr:serine hydrolase domain-containing protein [Archangium sp.]
MSVLLCSTLALVIAAPLDGGWSVDAGAPFPPATVAALQRVVLEARSVGPVAGLAIAVLHDDQLWLDTSGAASLTPFRKVTPGTSFRVASITKTFTAAAVMRLVEQGRLELEADVRAQVPEFPAKDGGVVTVQTLLNHTSGIGTYTSPADGRTVTAYSTEQSLGLFKDRPLLAPPGAAFVYSSYGYVLLGALVERVAHRRFGEHLREAFLGPLGLRDTGLEDRRSTAPGATGYSMGSRGLVAARALDISSRFSSGGLRSTVGDVITWARAWLDGAVVSETSWRKMTTPAVTTDGFSPDYGLGFAVYPMRGRRVVAHAGGQPGASSILLMVPEERFAVVVLSNVSGRGVAINRLATGLMEVVLDQGVPRRALAARDVADEVRFDAMSRAMSHGLVAARQEPRAAEAEVSAAFAWARELLSDERLAAAPREVEETFRNGYHPKAGRRSLLLGAEVARLLAERRGAAVLAEYPRRGALAFFADYVAACAGRACPHPLEPAFAAHVVRLNEAWEAIPPALRSLRGEDLMQTRDVAALLAPLEKVTVHPELVDELTRQAARERTAGRAGAARQVLELSARLHPNSAYARLALAEDAAWSGDRPRASLHLAKAFELRPQPFGAEFLKDRSETLRFGASAAVATSVTALFAEASRRNAAGAAASSR